MNLRNSDKLIIQNLREEAEISCMYTISLLFRNKINRPATHILLEKLKKQFGSAKTVLDSELSSYVLDKQCIAYNNEQRVSPQLIITECNLIKEPLGDNIARTQFWDCPDAIELLDSCLWQVIIGDFTEGSFSAVKRADILFDWLEIALELFPTCDAVYFHASGKLLTAEDVRNNPYSGPLRFIYGGMNARLFNVYDGDDMIVDTLGLYALGVPDVQYYFHTLDPNIIIQHAYDIIMYQFENNTPIESGDIIEGIDQNSEWDCRYERSLIQPSRTILDISAGNFAARIRE